MHTPKIIAMTFNFTKISSGFKFLFYLLLTYSISQNCIAQWFEFVEVDINLDEEIVVPFNLNIVSEGTPFGIWEFGEPQKEIFDLAYSVPNVLITSRTTSYTNSLKASFMIDLDGENPIFSGWLGSNVVLSFYQKMDTSPGLDGGYIEVSYDEGESWFNVFEDTVACDGVWTEGMMYLPTDTLFNGEPGFSGLIDDWTETVITWPFYFPVLQRLEQDDGNEILRFLIRFTFISDDISEDNEGWMLDNFNIRMDRSSSVEEQEFSSIKLYPNPLDFNSILHLNLSGNYGNSLKCEVYSLHGKLLMQKEYFTSLDKIEMDCSALNSGSYLIKLLSENGKTQSFRFSIL